MTKNKLKILVNLKIKVDKIILKSYYEYHYNKSNGN